VNMESIRHTGATVLGLSVVDRQLVETKKASGEISKVTLFLKPRSLNKEVNCTEPSPSVRIPGYGSVEISKVTPLFLKPRSLNKEVNCTVPSPPVRIPCYGYKDIEAQRFLWFGDLSQPSNRHNVFYPSIEQHVFLLFIDYRGHHRKGASI
jgi:hypothetical protein